MYQVSLFFVFLSLIQLIQGLDCPLKELLSPCKCYAGQIICHQTSLSSSELVDLFKKISRESTELHFNNFLISQNSNLTELRANTFQNVTFNTIHVFDCPNLVHVDEDAFNGVQDIVTIVEFFTTGIGRSKNRTIFDILNKFTNVKEIYLFDNSHENTTIPAGAFTKLKRLRQLAVESEKFSRIASGAFNVDNFFDIFISLTNISIIEDNAFYSEEASDNVLTLDLLGNRLLSGDSFADKAFSNIGKPTKLYLGNLVGNNTYWKTPITYLPEKTFLPFLKISNENRIVLNKMDYHLDCNDCRNAWLKNNPNELKKVNDGSSPLICANKKKIDDGDNFQNCTILH